MMTLTDTSPSRDVTTLMRVLQLAESGVTPDLEVMSDAELLCLEGLTLAGMAALVPARPDRFILTDAGLLFLSRMHQLDSDQRDRALAA
jgi:hypothetical protein